MSGDQSAVESSQEAIDRLMGAVEGPFAGADTEDLPLRMAPPADIPSPDYFPPIRPRRAYSYGQATTSPLEPEESESGQRSRGRREESESDHSELSKKPQNLEDLYSMFPKIGDGMYRIRVERLAPTVHRTLSGGVVHCQGVLGDFDEPIPFDEFQTRFGGQKYRVSVLGPLKPGDPQLDARGNPYLRTLRSVEFAVQGSPNLEVMPMPRPAQPESNKPTPNFYKMSPDVMNIPFVNPVEIERIRVENEYRRLEREAEERVQAHRELRDTQAQALAASARMPEKIVQEVRTQSAQTIDLLKTQLDDMRSQNASLRTEADRLRGEILSKNSEFEVRVRQAENEKVQQLKSEHERELRRVTQDLGDKLEKITTQHRDDMARLTGSHALELQRLESQASREREMLVRDNERRESMLSKDNERERNAMRDTYEARISQLKDTYDARIRDLQLTFDRESAAVKEAKDREIASLKESRDREVQAIRSQFEMQTTVTKETSTLRSDQLNQEILRLREEVTHLRTQVEDKQNEVNTLRAAQHKEPEEALENATRLAGLMGWGPKEDAAAAAAAAAETKTDEEKEDDGDWKKTAAKVGLGLVEKLPELTQMFVASRKNASEDKARQDEAVQQAFAEQRARVQQSQQAQLRRQRQLAAQQQAQMLPPGMPPGSMVMQGPIMGPQVQPPMYAPQAQALPPGQVPMQRQAVAGFPSQQAQQQQQSPQARPGTLRVGPVARPQQATVAPRASNPAPYPTAEQIAQMGPVPTQPGPFDDPTPQTQEIRLEEQRTPEVTQVSTEVPAPSPSQPGAEEEKFTLDMIPPEFLQEAFTELEDAIKGGIVPPGLWARGFMAKVGDDLAKAIVKGVTVDQLVEKARENPTSLIVTRDGQQFLHKVWAEIESA